MSLVYWNRLRKKDVLCNSVGFFRKMRFLHPEFTMSRCGIRGILNKSKGRCVETGGGMM